MKTRSAHRASRSSHNSLLPVNRLPRELISKVFRYALLESGVHDSEQMTRIWFCYLVRLTGVCQHWRYSGIADAWLWTGIVFRTARPGVLCCLPDILTRSKGMQLHMQLGKEAFWFQGPESENCMAEIVKSAPRVRQFVVEFDLSAPSAFRRLSFPMPNLISLLINVGNYKNWGLSQLFGGHMPQLQNLCLQWFTSWPPGMFVNLRVVVLRNQAVHIELSRLLTFLEQSPALERLSLISYGPLRGDLTSTGRRVGLGCLCKLELVNCHSLLILSHLELPALTQVTIVHPFSFLTSAQILEFQFANVMLALPFNLHHLHTLDEITAVEIRVEKHHYRFLTLNPDHNSFLSVTQGTKHFQPQEVAAFVHRSFINLMQHTSFTKISRLVIKQDPDTMHDGGSVPRELWEVWLRRLNQLESLQVPSVPYEDLHSALITKDESGCLLCPKLTVLECFVEIRKVADAEVLDVILEMLKMRRAARPGGFQLLPLISFRFSPPEVTHDEDFRKDFNNLFEARREELRMCTISVHPLKDGCRTGVVT